MNIIFLLHLVLVIGVILLQVTEADPKKGKTNKHKPKPKPKGSKGASRSGPKKPKVTGGQDAKVLFFPYQTLIQDVVTYQFCGGTIYNKDTIITAASCFIFRNGTKKTDEYANENIRLHAGFQSVEDLLKKGQEARVKQIIFHPDYVPEKFFADIAILKLVKGYKYVDRVKPVRISSRGAETAKVGARMEVSGWGYKDPVHTKDTEGVPADVTKLPTKLQWTKVTAISSEQCTKLFEKFPEQAEVAQKEEVICVGGKVDIQVAPGDDPKFHDVCEGDSGGPVICNDPKNKDLRVLCGIIVAGASLGCGKGNPQLYTRVESYLTWIKENGGKPDENA